MEKTTNKIISAEANIQIISPKPIHSDLSAFQHYSRQNISYSHVNTTVYNPFIWFATPHMTPINNINATRGSSSSSTELQRSTISAVISDDINSSTTLTIAKREASGKPLHSCIVYLICSLQYTLMLIKRLIRPYQVVKMA